MNNRNRALIQRVLNTFLNETCTLYARVDSAYETGAQGTAFVAVASGVKCRVINSFGARGDSGEVAQRETLRDTFRIILPVGTVIGNDYRVQVGAVLYEVTGVVDDRSDAADVQVRVERVRGD